MITEQLFNTGQQKFSSENQDSTWSLSATGDYWLNQKVADTIKTKGLDNFAANISQFTQADISITNLEMALCHDRNAPHQGVAPGAIELFKQVHQVAPFSVYALANNHILDVGNEQLIKTLDYFKQQSIAYVGAGIDKTDAMRPLFIQQQGIKVGILAFAQNEGQLATDSTPGVIELTTSNIIPAVKDLVDQCDVPVVILHEGFEFTDFPRMEFKQLCHKIATLGVKVIIGHHSHVPQGIEYIEDCLIFYSLGNFLFNIDYHNAYPWTCKSFVPVITFNASKIIALKLKPLVIELDPYLVRPADNTECGDILAHLKCCSEIIANDERMLKEFDQFYTNTLLPEWFNFIKEYGNRHNGDYSVLIEEYKTSNPIRNVFTDFITLYH